MAEAGCALPDPRKGPGEAGSILPRYVRLGHHPKRGSSIATISPGKGPPEEGVGGSLIQSERAPAVVIYIQVASLGESQERAEALGGRAIMQPIDLPNGPTIAQIEDPEGNLIGLVQM